jgi:hypothetical protein
VRRVEAGIDRASPRAWIDAGDPPLYLACAAADVLVPDCAHDHRPFSESYLAAHGSDTNAVWIDQVDQPDLAGPIHFLIDGQLNYSRLNAFLDRFTG